MEGFVAFVDLLTNHPVVEATVIVFIMVVLILSYRDGKVGRAKLHVRVDGLKEEVTEKVGELRKDFSKHAEEDAQRGGSIEKHMEIVEKKLT